MPADSGGGARRPALRIETLESRLAMDGAGFVNTDPPEDPDSIVGVAGVVAQDDYVEAPEGTRTLRISPLENDELPEGAADLTIKSVSATRLGAAVTISEDGRHLLYTVGEEGLSSSDSFYYIVETEEGDLGKANVQICAKHQTLNRGGHRPTPSSNDRFTVLEDSGERRLDVLANDRQLVAPVIVAVSTTSRGGAVRIADDGSALFYTPPAGESGRDQFTYTARGADGQEFTYWVRVDIEKPYEIVDYMRSRNAGDDARLDFGMGAVVLDPLANDRLRGPIDLPARIDGFTAPDHAGTVELADDGRTFLFTPAEGFQGSFGIGYTVRYGAADHQTVNGAFEVSVRPHSLATPNWFAIDPTTEGATTLDVLSNDPLLRPYANGRQAHYLPSVTRAVSLTIIEVSAGSASGTIRVAEDGQTLSYAPADGFRGDETFTYTLEDSTGSRQTAEVTLHVADPVTDPLLASRFATEGELQQFLIDRAVQRYARQFGQHETRYSTLGLTTHVNLSLDAAAVRVTNFASSDVNSHSETNTQVEGVDEADIVETDGRYVYTFSEGQLAIVDLQDPASPRLVSITEFEGAYDQMYLQGDRITLLRSGTRWRGDAEVLVLELGDRTFPSVVERTVINGQIVDSRAIGDRVHLVVHKNFDFPQLSGEWVADPMPSGASGESGGGSVSTSGVVQGGIAVDDNPWQSIGQRRAWRNETLDQYLDRARGGLFETGLPTFETFDAAGELVASGLLTSPTDVHRPIAGDDLAVAFVTIDAGDAAPGPVAGSTTFIADSQATVYVSTESAYVFSYDAPTDTTTIHKLSLEADNEGHDSRLEATGAIRGRLLNQFSADEHDGLLRVATTQQEREPSAHGRLRQTRLFNNLLILEQQGSELAVVGEITNLAPTETIHAVRYQGDRAFVVTFRVVDPLFAIDLSDPTEPTVEGALKIPGFSNYLHPVGEDYLIGIGRDADEVTGRAGPLQVTLFNVADLSNPTVADQLTFEGADWVNSEAWIDHHAVSFFASDEEGVGVLALPINWAERVETGEGFAHTTRHAGLFTIDVSTGGGGALVSTGQITHDPAPTSFQPIRFGSGVITTGLWRAPVHQQSSSTVRRAVRVDESLVTVSAGWVEVHELDSPDERLGRVYLGQPAIRDHFTIEEDSGPQTLDVLANDFPLADGQPPSIAAVTQPTTGGVVAIAEDGQSLLFTPEENYFGSLSFTYTIEDPARGEVEATVSLWVQNTPDTPIAIDDEAAVAADSDATVIDVLANDIDPDGRLIRSIGVYEIDVVEARPTISTSIRIDHIDLTAVYFPSRLAITEVSTADNGGTVSIDSHGRLSYQPAEGFEGVEMFTYTIENASGLTDVGLVTVVVGGLLAPATTESTPLGGESTNVDAGSASLLGIVPLSGLGIAPAQETTQARAEERFSAPSDNSLLFLLRHTETAIDEAIDSIAASSQSEELDSGEALTTGSAHLSLSVQEAVFDSY